METGNSVNRRGRDLAPIARPGSLRFPEPQSVSGSGAWAFHVERPKAARPQWSRVHRLPPHSSDRETESRRPSKTRPTPPWSPPGAHLLAASARCSFLELSGRQRPPIRARGGAKLFCIMPEADQRQLGGGSDGAGPQEAPPIAIRRLPEPRPQGLWLLGSWLQNSKIKNVKSTKLGCLFLPESAPPQMETLRSGGLHFCARSTEPPGGRSYKLLWLKRIAW